MRGINIIGFLVGVYLLVRSYLLVKKREEDVLNFLIWLIVGSGLIITGLSPGVFNYIMKVLGMEERPYTMFAVGILVLYLLLFRLVSSMRRIESENSKLNEEITLLKEKVNSLDLEVRRKNKGKEGRTV